MSGNVASKLYQFIVKLHRTESKSFVSKEFQAFEFIQLHTKLVLVVTRGIKVSC